MAASTRTAGIALALGVLLAAPSIARAGEGELAALVERLRRGDAGAKEHFVRMGPPAVSPLFALVGDKEARVAAQARSALRWIAAQAAEPSAPASRRKEILDAVLPHLRGTPRPSESRAVADALESIGVPAEAVSALVAGIKPEPPRPEREMAVELLGLLGTEAEVPILGKAFLEDDTLDEPILCALAQIPGGMGAVSCIGGHAGRHLAFDTPARPVLPATRALALRLYAAHCASNPPPAADRWITVDFFMRASQDAEEEVRVAALAGLGVLGDAAGEPVLLEALRTGTPKVRAAAFKSYLALGLARRAAGDAPAARTVCEKALELAADDSQRAAALSALGRLGDAAALPAIQSGLKSGAPAVRLAAYAALAQINAEAGAEAIAAALADAPDEARPALAEALAAARDPKLAGQLLAAARDADPLVALAALDGLSACATAGLSSRVPGPGTVGQADRGTVDQAAASAILAIAESTRSEAVRAAALRLAVRLGGGLAASKQDSAAVDVFRRVLTLSESEADRAEALRGLGRVGGPKALDALLPLLERTAREPLRELAVEACLTIGDAALASGDRDGALKAFKKVADLRPDGALAGEVTRKLGALGGHYNLASRKGFLTSWWMIGPFPAPDFAAAKKAWFPEHEIDLTKSYDVEGRTLAWQLVRSEDPKGAMRLADKLRPNAKAVAYGYVELMADAPRELKLRIGRHDGLSVWLNGRPVFDTHDAHNLADGEMAGDVGLAAGVNRLLIKTSNMAGPWEFAIRLTEKDGKPVGAK